MRLIRYSDVTTYAASAAPFLLAHEAEHCRAIGILTTLQRGEPLGASPPYLALVEDDEGRVVAAALATPPRNLVLSLLSPGAEPASEEILCLLADDARVALPNLSGAQGPVALVRRFAELWAAPTLTRGAFRLEATERIYRLSTVQPVRPVPGAMRRITEADRPLLREWLTAYSAESLGGAKDPHSDTQIDRMLRFASSGMYLWEASESAVSLAGYRGPTPHGVRVGPVYTPPEARGKGYASALVAALSQRLLDEGRQFVFLLTNLANPTSNHIYQVIGYQPVSDVAEYRFERRDGATN